MITSTYVCVLSSSGLTEHHGVEGGVAEKQQTQKANSTADYSTLLEIYHTRVYEYMAYICCSIYEQALYG